MRSSVHVILPALAGVVLIAALAGAQTSVPAGLLEARRAYNAALQKGDKAAYAKLLTDDVTWISRSGRLQDKATLVSERQPDPTPPAEPEIRMYPGGAVLIGTRGGTIRYVQLWVQKGGQWRLAAHHGTEIAGATPPAGPINAVPPSSKAPASVGAPADLEAIVKAIAAVSAANAKGDGQAFASLVTDQFVSVGSQGQVLGKQERIAAITGNPRPAPSGSAEQVSTRVHGDMAVTILVPPVSAGQPRIRQTIVHVRRGGRWLRAAIITTPIATKVA